MKILVIELLGLADTVLATGAVKSLQRDGHEVSILCKQNTRDLLCNYLPNIENWHILDCNWISDKKKYRLWKWNLRGIFSLIKILRSNKYDMSLSVRVDARDDILAYTGGIKERLGYKKWTIWPFLNDGFVGAPIGHKVEVWERLTSYITQSVTDDTPVIINDIKSSKSIVIHVGASVGVRRWPIEKIEQLIIKLKSNFNDYVIVLICDSDGFGLSIRDKVDKCYNNVTLEKKIEIMSSASLVIGNNSGSTHIAAALNVNTCTIFGPQFSETSRPWSKKSDVVEGKDCEYKPCEDLCRYEVPNCIHDISVSEVWEKVKVKLGES